VSLGRAALVAGVISSLVACAEQPSVRPALTPATPPSTPPVVTPEAPPTVDGDVTVASVNGIQVIVERMPGAAFAAGQLYVRGGTRNWTAQNAGIEDLALRVAAAGGTASLDKTTFSRKLAALGASVSGDAHNDFSGLYLKAPVSAWDDALPLLVDAFLSPALPPAEVELVRTQMLAELHHEQESPESQIWTLERTQLFAGHPYANRSIGSLASLTAITPGDLGPYLARLRETSRLVFVAVGDLDPAHVVRQLLGALPRGSYVEAPLPPLVFGPSHLVTLERKLPTNYCETAFPAPRWSDPDWVTGLVTMSGYSWRLWQEVRTKRNLTYAVSAYVNENFAYPFGAMEVTAVNPNAAMRVMLDEARRLRDEPMPEQELAGFKSVFLTGYLESHETPDGQAASLADAQLYAGDWHLARTLPDRVRAVTAPDVQAYVKKYLGHLQAAVVGDPAKVDQAIFTSF
jgi:zinc protease